MGKVLDWESGNFGSIPGSVIGLICDLGKVFFPPTLALTCLFKL